MLRILVLIVALGASGFTAWVLVPQGAMPVEGAPAAQSPQLPTEEVLTASSDLMPGALLTETDLHWKSWPTDTVSSGFIRRTAKPDAASSLKGARVSSRVLAGEPIREEKLIPASAGLLATLLLPGKRAVAIRVSAESTAGGFILPNDQVDVIHTVAATQNGTDVNVSHTLLRNIRILAVDQQAAEANGQPVVAKTVTLELDPAQAEVIATAQASGVLSLSLRSAADSGERPTAEVRGHTIRVVRGGRTEIVRVQ